MCGTFITKSGPGGRDGRRQLVTPSHAATVAWPGNRLDLRQPPSALHGRGHTPDRSALAKKIQRHIGRYMEIVRRQHVKKCLLHWTGAPRHQGGRPPPHHHRRCRAALSPTVPQWRPLPQPSPAEGSSVRPRSVSRTGSLGRGRYQRSIHSLTH